jgi:hypothetical protein
VTRRILTVALLVLLAIAAASCAGEDQRGSPAHQVSEWVANTSFGQDIGTLVGDNALIYKEKSTGGMHAACGSMEIDADTANGELPIHGAPQVTDWLSTAYGLEGAAATECYDAGVTNKTLLAKAERDLTKAQRLFTRSLIAIQSIDGRLPSTTTTTENGPISIFG